MNTISEVELNKPMSIDDLTFVKINSNNPGNWFKFKVLSNNIHVADFETQIDNGYTLDGKRESVYTIYKIIVKNSHRHRGIGSQIINYCQRLALEKGLRKVLCWIKPLDKGISERDLINFYQSNDMRIVTNPENDNKYAIKDIK